jgi:hypothetical protein
VLWWGTGTSALKRTVLFTGKKEAKEESRIVALHMYMTFRALSSHLQSLKMDSTCSFQIDAVKSQKNVPPKRDPKIP